MTLKIHNDCLKICFSCCGEEELARSAGVNKQWRQLAESAVQRLEIPGVINLATLQNLMTCQWREKLPRHVLTLIGTRIIDAAANNYDTGWANELRVGQDEVMQIDSLVVLTAQSKKKQFQCWGYIGVDREKYTGDDKNTPDSAMIYTIDDGNEANMTVVSRKAFKALFQGRHPNFCLFEPTIGLDISFSFLNDPKDLASAARVNKQWNRRAQVAMKYLP